MSNRYLTIDGTTTEAYGLVMLDTSEPYRPAPVQDRIVEIAGSSRHVDATDFATGHPEYAPVTGEHADFWVSTALLGQSDTQANREAIVLAFVRAVHGQLCAVVDSLHAGYTMSCRCDVDVDETSSYRLVKLTWTRQAVRDLGSGDMTLTGSFAQVAFDPDSCAGPIATEPTGFDTSMAGWAYELQTTQPTQPTDAYTVTESAGTATGVKSNTFADGAWTWQIFSTYGGSGCTAQWDLSVSGSKQTSEAYELSGFGIELEAGGNGAYVSIGITADGVTVCNETLSLVPSQYMNKTVYPFEDDSYTIPAGTQSVTIVFEVAEGGHAKSMAADMSDSLADICSLMIAYYGDADFDYSGYYEYQDGTGMVDSTTLATPAWASGLVFAESSTYQAVQAATITAIGSDPTWVSDLFYGSFTDLSINASLVSDTGYPSALTVEPTHDCAVTLGGRVAAIPGGGTYLTDLLVDRGTNAVNVFVSGASAYDSVSGEVDDFSAELTWSRGDV